MTLGHQTRGCAPDLIYAKGANIPSPPICPSSGTDFDKQACSLLLVGVGFRAPDLSCHIKRDEKAGKYSPLLAKLIKQEWPNGVQLTWCEWIPIRCAGTLLSIAYGDTGGDSSDLRQDITIR